MSDRDPAEPEPAVELRAWRQFVALAEGLHFGRAALRLHMTQPPLTQAIQKIERQLGVQLFERTRRSVTLTPEGVALVEPARQLLKQANALSDLARAASAGRMGTIRLGFVSTVGFGPLPGWLRRFREARPGVTVELHEATADVQMTAFAKGDIDAGFVLHAPGMPPESPVPLQRFSVGVEPLVLALPAGAPGVATRRQTPAQLLAQPLVIFPRQIAPSLFDAILAFYHGHGVTPVIAQEAIQMQTIVNLVSAGLGVALVPRVMMQLERPGVVYRPLPSALARAAPRGETSLLWPANASPAVMRLVEFVRGSLRARNGSSSTFQP